MYEVYSIECGYAATSPPRCGCDESRCLYLKWPGKVRYSKVK